MLIAPDRADGDAGRRSEAEAEWAAAANDFLKRRDFDRSIEILDQLVQRNPDNKRLREALSRAILEREKWKLYGGDDDNPLYFGRAVAKWEGDTLVVDTVGFNEAGWIGFGSFPQTEKLHVTERFRRTDLGHLEREVTFDDPTTFTRQWTVSLPMTKTDGPLYEYACHEGNYGMAGLLGGARAMEKEAAKKK